MRHSLLPAIVAGMAIGVYSEFANVPFWRSIFAALLAGVMISIVRQLIN